MDKIARAAIVESPSAIWRIEGASAAAEGALEVSADCEDSISYRSRGVMMALRSATKLV